MFQKEYLNDKNKKNQKEDRNKKNNNSKNNEENENVSLISELLGFTLSYIYLYIPDILETKLNEKKIIYKIDYLEKK